MSKLTQEQKNMKKDDIISQLEKKDGMYNEIFRAASKIKGTYAYQKTKQSDLMAMVKQLGLPGMFETFSYADTQWDDLREILANYEPKLASKDLTQDERYNLMYEATQKYPHVVNSFFVEKFDK